MRVLNRPANENKGNFSTVGYFFVKHSINSKTSSLYSKFSKKRQMIFAQKRLDFVFGFVWQEKQCHSNLLSVVQFGLEHFQDLDGNTVLLHRFFCFLDLFYIMVIDWFARAEPSRDSFRHFFWMETFPPIWKFLTFFHLVKIVFPYLLLTSTDSASALETIFYCS